MISRALELRRWRRQPWVRCLRALAQLHQAPPTVVASHRVLP